METPIRFARGKSESHPVRVMRSPRCIVCLKMKRKVGLDKMPHFGTDAYDIDINIDDQTVIQCFVTLLYWFKATVPLNSYLRARKVLGDHSYANIRPMHVTMPIGDPLHVIRTTQKVTNQNKE